MTMSVRLNQISYVYVLNVVMVCTLSDVGCLSNNRNVCVFSVWKRTLHEHLQVQAQQPMASILTHSAS